MHWRLLAGLAGVASVALASTAAAEPTPGCFFVRDIGDPTVGGPHTLYFKVRDRSHMHALAYFHVETRSDCNVTGTDTEHGGFHVYSNVFSSRHAQMICKPEDVAINAGTNCPIATIERMSPAEVAALPRHIRP
jgi:hypothetical protein